MKTHFALCASFWFFGAASGLVASKSLGSDVQLGVAGLVCVVAAVVSGLVAARQKGEGAEL